MLNYTVEQIKNILTDIFKTENFTIIPIGNHHLKRHLVYEVRFDAGEKYICKLYYRSKRRSREIASLKILENSTVKCPKIIKYGNLKDGTEWLITKYIEGQTLDSIINEIPNENKIKIFEQMGEELGKLHSFKVFEFFGQWDETGQSIYNIVDYYQYFVKEMESDIEQIINQDLPSKETLMEAIKQIRHNYGLLHINIVPRLVHNDFDGRNILVKKTEETYNLSAIIDFEASYPRNSEEDFISLYYRYFLENDSYEKAFSRGYKKHLDMNNGFNERLHMYLLCFSVRNCSWSYRQAPDYYKDNIEFLRKILDVN